MKKLFPLLLIVLTTFSCNQPSHEADKALIEKVILDSFDEVWGKLDSKNIAKYYTDDFLLLENGEVWNNDTIASYLEHAALRSPRPTRLNSIEVIDVKISGETAWIAYHNRATFSIDNQITRKAYWLESATAIKTEQGWKLDMLHSTRVSNELITQ
jgi:ketosteroid isomerase-like protein